MQISKQGLEALKLREGFRAKAYKDTADIWTIGYGTIKIGGVPVKEGDTITIEKATECLLKDIKWAEDCVNKETEVHLEQYQFDALVSFVYNIGTAAYSRSTLLRLLNQGKYLSAADQLLKWVYSGGKITPGLLNRRHSERKQFLGA